MLPAGTSCMAATGDTLAALRAGDRAATRVTSSPASPATITVRMLNTRPPMGRPRSPSALSRPSRPAAMAIPAASPMAEAMTPTATASAITEPSTWRLLAPSARSRPFSRVRCATVIENVLKIMNAPTSSAMTAKIIMNVLKKPMACWNESCISLVTVAPVTASIPCGSAVRRLAASCCCETPGLATNRTLVTFPGPATRRCATGMVNRATLAPPGLSAAPNLTIPTTRKRWGAPTASTVVMSPTRR